MQHHKFSNILKDNVFMDLEAIKNMKYIFKQVISRLKKFCAALNTFFLFSL